MNTLISIVVPNFNKEIFVNQTLDSLISQSFKNWEVIIIDDCSTDNSVKIFEKYIAKDARFKLLRNHKNLGGAYSRNRGLKSAKGSFIVFLDSDDILTKNCLSLRYEKIKDKEVDFLVFPMETFKEKIGDRKKLWIPKPKQNHLLAFLSHNLPWQTMQPIWRKDFLLSLKGFDEDYLRLQDVELHTRALLHPEVRYEIVNDVLPDCYYRVSSEKAVFSQEEFLINLVDGVKLYLRKMSDLLQNKRVSSKHEITALKGTLISMLNRLLIESKLPDASSETTQLLIRSLHDEAEEAGLLDSKDKLLLRAYSCGHTIGLSRIKGFNFLFKKILTKCT